MKKNLPLILFFLFSGSFLFSQTDYVQASVDFLSNLRYNKSTAEQEEMFKNVSVETLEEQLDTDVKRLVFWVNVYNGFIQKILKEHPEYYDDRRTFFSKEQIPIIQRTLSFADIEHGMIRHSQYEYFLGYVTNLFAPRYERKLRVKNRDPRIHFALNCGAIDCPPVAIYTEKDYDAQIDISTEKYLNRITTVDEVNNKVSTTPLMSWFRGDFGGKRGAIKMLSRYGAIPHDNGWKLEFKSYDWTLDLDNYIDL